MAARAPNKALVELPPGRSNTPNGIRTRVTALKGRGPRPLADGGARAGYPSGGVVRPLRHALQGGLQLLPGFGLGLGVLLALRIAGRLEIAAPGRLRGEGEDRDCLR